MTAEALDVSRETTDLELPRGPAMVYKRAGANGFRVRIARGLGSREVKRYELLFDEDGKPLMTESGKRQRRREIKVTVPAVSIGLHLQHDEAQQGQCAWWVGDEADDVDKPVCWAWPADGSDVRRRIGATQLGTLVDLEALREASIAAARADIDERLSLAAIRARAINGARRK